ncbi:MAG: hypothetical protein ACRENA_03955 [Vulcanimicrobiaceae bacterium]
MIVLTATRLEERTVKRELKSANARVVRSGVGRGGSFDEDVISCGLGGGLRRDVPSGTVVIASEIARPTGERVVCDTRFVEALASSAHALGVTPLVAPLVTSSALVRESGRQIWADRGFAAVDMESGLVFAPRVAAVRVLLDTPERELSEGWLQPWSLLMRPSMWVDLPWLAAEAPRFARLAAKIVAAALTNIA